MTDGKPKCGWDHETGAELFGDGPFTAAMQRSFYCNHPSSVQPKPLLTGCSQRHAGGSEVPAGLAAPCMPRSYSAARQPPLPPSALGLPLGVQDWESLLGLLR